MSLKELNRPSRIIISILAGIVALWVANEVKSTACLWTWPSITFAVVSKWLDWLSEDTLKNSISTTERLVHRNYAVRSLLALPPLLQAGTFNEAILKLDEVENCLTSMWHCCDGELELRSQFQGCKSWVGSLKVTLRTDPLSVQTNLRKILIQLNTKVKNPLEELK